MCNISEVLNCILFADDTSIFMSHTDVQYLQNNFNDEIDKLIDWLYNNKLVLNLDKTNFMVFTNMQIDKNNIVVKIKDTEIKRVNSLKFLGIIIDDKLTWNEHTGVICNTLSKNIGIMNNLRFLPKEVLLMLYNALVSPYLNYCIVIWANSSIQNMNRLFKLQKRAIRIISHSSYLAHTAPSFSCLNILNIYKLYEFQCAIFMYMCHKNVLPGSLLMYFDVNSTVHNYETRSANNYRLPLIRTNAFQKSIFFKGPKIWNEIPNDIKSSLSLNVFKKNYKHPLLGNSNSYSTVQ